VPNFTITSCSGRDTYLLDLEINLTQYIVMVNLEIFEIEDFRKRQNDGIVTEFLSPST
jgi:hypothetical protein